MIKIGPIRLDKESFFIGQPGKWVGWHIDSPLGDCYKQYGAPPRVYLHAYTLGVIQIGLPDPKNNFRPSVGQVWSPSLGYRHTKPYRTVSFHPGKQLTCQFVVGTRTGRNGKILKEVCGASRWHLGEHTAPTEWSDQGTTSR